ncbi:MAG: DNA mismatch repair protein MutS [Hyphomicrobiales bacterium]|nr:DNA mismatch repair protein MutS [Hyphomicrobiales bacterium]
MTHKPGKRRLSDEERRLWAAVKRTTEPLAPTQDVQTEPEPAKAPMATEASTPAAPKMPAPERKRPPAAGALDRRTVRRLSRGRTEVDGRIDLHGLTQDVAHRRLLHFVEDAQARGARIVLVITGKGNNGAPERGVLRRAVPQWVRSAAFKPYVAGISEAGRRHGGAGAIYIRIRRRRN